MDANGRLILEATVTSVGEGPYYYPACRQCYSKLIEQTNNFCPKCRRAYADAEVNQRYRVCLTVSDGISLANVTAFGNVFTPFFGCSAADLDKCHGQFGFQVTPALLRCALEKTMIGSSLLFGFKGIMKKPKGLRVTLRDIENLGRSMHSSYPGRHRDLIAFQILPQCDFQYPTPVIQHLQKLDNIIQNHKEIIDVSHIDLDYFTHILSYAVNTNRSMTKEYDSKTKSQDYCESISHCESDQDVSKFILSSAEESEVSINFSCNNSIQKSWSVADCFTLSNDDSYKSHQDMNYISSEHGAIVNPNDSSTDFTSFSSGKSSCSTKNKRRYRNRKHTEVFPNESSSVISRQSKSKVYDTSERENGLYTSFQLFSSPEISREKVSRTHSSSRLFSDISLVDIASSPTEFDKTRLKSSENVYTPREPNALYQQSNQCIRKGNGRKLLTLKSNENGNEMQSLQSDRLSPALSSEIANSSDCERGAVFNSPDCADDNYSRRVKSNVNRCQLSLTEFPESEDFDIFIAAADSEQPSRGQNSNIHDSHIQTCTDTTRQTTTKACDQCVLNKGNELKSNFCEKCLAKSPTFHKSFIHMPESEDLDLFLAAIDLEQLQSCPKTSEVSPKVVVWDRNNEEKVGAQSITYEYRRVLVSKHSSALAFNYSNSKRTKHAESGLALNDLKSNQIKHTETEICGDSDDIYSTSQTQMIENTRSSSSGNLDHFNDSCDLFESPLQSQISLHTMVKDDILKDKELHGDQNCSNSLFSSSFSSRRESIDVDKNLQQQSYNDTCMDLFSPALQLQTPRRPRQSININNNNTNRNCFNSSFNHTFYCNSPDLFSSQEKEL